ncbi:hypothetical protein ABIA99_005263 [Bradyrhizobium sp. LB12.1]|uniref:hypothetical protein n=1 Tax=Bradyrhizobium sp. LB12.1 TaxID=3156327 RepID=UPI00339749BC
MSRVERVKQLGNPSSRENWCGAGRDKANIERWIKRADDNSKVAPRARGGEMKLPNTGDVTLHDTGGKSRTSTAEIDKRMAGKDDLNSDGGSSFMPGVRRKA